MDEQYQQIIENIDKLCNKFCIEENKNSIKIIYLDKITKKTIKQIFPKPEEYNENSQEKECIICLSKIKKKQKIQKLLKCNHIFHKECIDKWFISSQKIICPICKI